MRRFSAFAFCVLVVTVGSCKTSNTNQTPANTSSGTSEISTASPSPAQSASPSAPPVMAEAKAKVDACALISSKEIEAVQGEAVLETKLSGQAGGGLQISQCFFTLPTFSNSISLLIAQKGDGADAKDPKDFWHETFVKGAAKEREREQREKKDRDKDKKAGRRGEKKRTKDHHHKK